MKRSEMKLYSSLKHILILWGECEGGYLPFMFISPPHLKLIIMSIKSNKKKSNISLPNGYMSATQAGNASPQYMQSAVDQFGIPEDGIFNPYDYISQKNYKMNRRGQASYEEDLARLTYIADLRQQEFQNQYNSPENQAKLMREAGLNPDLLGVSSQPSMSGPSAQSSPMSGIPTNLQQATNAVGIVSNVASLVTGMLSGGLSISQAFTSKASSDLTLLSQAMDLFSGYSSQGFNIKNLPLSNRVRKILNKSFEGSLAFDNSGRKLSATTNNLISAVFDSNYNRYSKEFNPLFNAPDKDLSGTVTLDEWSYVWEPLSKFAADTLSTNFKNDNRKSHNDSDYLFTTSSDGSSLGDMKGSFEIEKYSQNKFSHELRQPLREVVSRLRKINSPWSNFALIALYLVCQLQGLN